MLEEQKYFSLIKAGIFRKVAKGRDAAGLGRGRKDVHDKMGPLRAGGCAPRSTRGRKTESTSEKNGQVQEHRLCEIGLVC